MTHQLTTPEVLSQPDPKQEGAIEARRARSSRGVGAISLLAAASTLVGCGTTSEGLANTTEAGGGATVAVAEVRNGSPSGREIIDAQRSIFSSGNLGGSDPNKAFTTFRADDANFVELGDGRVISLTGDAFFYFGAAKKDLEDVNGKQSQLGLSNIATMYDPKTGQTNVYSHMINGKPESFLSRKITEAERADFLDRTTQRLLEEAKAKGGDLTLEGAKFHAGQLLPTYEQKTQNSSWTMSAAKIPGSATKVAAFTAVVQRNTTALTFSETMNSYLHVVDFDKVNSDGKWESAIVDVRDKSGVRWGSGLVAGNDGKMYIIGNDERIEGAFGCNYFVARADGDEITDKDSWRYWDGKHWQGDPTKSKIVIPARANINSYVSVANDGKSGFDFVYKTTFDDKMYEQTGKSVLDVLGKTPLATDAVLKDRQLVISGLPNEFMEGLDSYLPKVSFIGGKKSYSISVNGYWSTDPKEDWYGVYSPKDAAKVVAAN